MVVNAMMVAMVVHSEEQAQSMYHLTSSVHNPAPCAVLAESAYRYSLQNPPLSRKKSELLRMRFFRTLPRFRAYMAIKCRLPLEVVRRRHYSAQLYE
jgi:fatty acyl-CoA reductase